MAKLNNKQRQQIVAEYLNGKTTRELAKSNHVSQTAISKILNTQKSVQKCSDLLSAENSKTVMEWAAYWQSKSSIGQEISSRAFDLLLQRLDTADTRTLIALLKEFKDLFTPKGDDGSGADALDKLCAAIRENVKYE